MMQVSPTSLHALRGEAGQATAALLHPWGEALDAFFGAARAHAGSATGSADGIQAGGAS